MPHCTNMLNTANANSQFCIQTFNIVVLQVVAFRKIAFKRNASRVVAFKRLLNSTK